MPTDDGNVGHFYSPAPNGQRNSSLWLDFGELAPTLLSVVVTMREAKADNHVACVRFYDHGAGGIQLTAPLTISATLWRLMEGRYEWVFTFSGDADVFVLDSLLEHVHRLTGNAPGEWRFEFLAFGPRPDVLQEVEHRFHDLARSGVHHRVAVAPFDVPMWSDTSRVATLVESNNGGCLLH